MTNLSALRRVSAPAVEFAAHHRATLDLAIVLLAVLASAAAGLVVEDLLPADGHVVWSWFRVVVVLAVLLVLALLVGLRSRVTVGFGTLYYVRYLAEDMADWRQQDFASSNGDFLDVRVVTRSFSADATAVGIDVADDLSELARTVQAEMNNDRVDSGFTLAPNMLLPAALAFGNGMYWWSGMSLFELFPNSRLSWSPDPGWPALPNQGGGVEVEVSVDPRFSAGEPTVTVVQAMLTPTGGLSRVPCKSTSTVSVGVRDGGEWCGVEVLDMIAPRAGEAGIHRAQVDAATASIKTAQAIRSALHESDGGYVVVALKVPKTVAVAVGWLLNNGERSHAVSDPGCGHSACKNPACQRPWAHLITPYWDQAAQRFVLARVHRDQPDIATMVKNVEWQSVG